MPKSKKPSAVRIAAQSLRREILAAEEGAYLGLESDLIARLKVSRPTFRQAAKLLEHEELLIIKKGNQGGFYGGRPNAESVARAAVTYILTQRTSLEDVIATSLLVMDETVRLAAACRDDTLRDGLQALIRQSNDAPFDAALHVILEGRFSQQLAAMTERPMLALFVAVSGEFYQRYSIDFHRLRERMPVWTALRAELGEAVLKGDATLARRIAKRRSNIMTAWIAQDRGKDGLSTSIADIGVSIDELPSHKPMKKPRP